jgi:hypothetical protein
MISGLLLAIPLWAGIGSGIILFVLHRGFAASELAALAAAGVVELLLIRYAWQRQGWRFGLTHALATSALSGSAPAHRGSTLRRMGLLALLAASYLHYYYWEVQAQIATLPSVTVFVPTPRLG